jgi:hypothetical protein
VLAYEVLSNEAKFKFPEVVKGMRGQFWITVEMKRKCFVNAECQENKSQNDYVIRLRNIYLE